MSSYPCDFETNVEIDADEVLDYVRNNKDWFLSQLGKDTSSVMHIERKVQNIIDKFDYIRRYRDYSSTTREEHISEIEIYEGLLKIKEMIHDLD